MCAHTGSLCVSDFIFLVYIHMPSQKASRTDHIDLTGRYQLQSSVCRTHVTAHATSSMARGILLLLRLRQPLLRHRRPHPRPMSCCAALQLHRKLRTASLMLPRWLSAETCEMERRTVRCAVLATRHAGMESASGIHLFLVQASAGAVLRRPMLSLVYVVGQAVQTGHSETMRDSSESRAQSARIT